MQLSNPREQMLSQQIRAWGVSDEAVLATLRAVSREAFVPEPYRSLAFADWAIPLGHDQCMMTPKIEARLLQALAIQPSDRVLEVGTGSGYLTACLSHLGGNVLSIDIFPDFLQRVKKILTLLGLDNVEVEQQNWIDFRHDELFDVIAVTGSISVVEPPALAQLALGGRMFVVVGEPPVMQARLITRIKNQSYDERNLFETALIPLLDSRPRHTFSF